MDIHGNQVKDIITDSSDYERKELLVQYYEELYPQVIDNKMTFNEFILKVMIHFSNDDNNRSLPNIVDGFKPSQRKIMYGCFKRKIS